MGTKIRTASILWLTLLIAASSLYVFHVGSMWQTALTGAKDGSITLGAYVEASGWLSENLGANETTLVPMPNVFYVANPELKDRLISYSWLWDSAGVILQANTTEAEILKVRSYFVDFLNKSIQVRYVVRDWNDPYDTLLYEAAVNDTLMLLVHVVRVIPFTLSTGWSNMITIYERVHV